jgi:UDP-N-acetylmuramyl pentapeptide phosphotransferase/UDP-N-acetylglucosamine-1-phosphate transferase
MAEIIGGIITEAILDGLRYLYYRIRFGKKYKAILAERNHHHHERMYRNPLLQIVIILLVLATLALLVGSIYAGVNQLF